MARKVISKYCLKRLLVFFGACIFTASTVRGFEALEDRPFPITPSFAHVEKASGTDGDCFRPTEGLEGCHNVV